MHLCTCVSEGVDSLVVVNCSFLNGCFHNVIVRVVCGPFTIEETFEDKRMTKLEDVRKVILEADRTLTRSFQQLTASINQIETLKTLK